MKVEAKILVVINLLLMGLFQQSLHAQTWHAVGHGIGKFGSIRCFNVINDTLYLGGEIRKDSNAIGNGIISFDGAYLDSLACGPDGVVDNVETYNDGKIYICGNFIRICGDLSFSYLAKWNGFAWEHFNVPFTDSHTVNTIKSYNNQLYLGGDFYRLNNSIVNRIASWDGSAWHTVGGGVWDPMGGFVTNMAVYKGKLIVTGAFLKAGSINANNIASWDGTKWDTLAGGLNNGALCMYIDSVNNLLYVGGAFTKADTLMAHGLAVWDGNNWSVPGQCIVPYPSSITMFNGKIYVGGMESYPQTAQDTILAYWDGNNWTKVTGPDGTVCALSVYKGNLYVGGGFTNVNGDTSIKYIACYGDSCNCSVGIKETQTDNAEYLWQNIPNPFDKTTSIPYYVPFGSKGIMQIVDANGKLLKEYNLQQGKNKLDISLAQLKAGVYYYSIFIDGVKKKTLKMVIQ